MAKLVSSPVLEAGRVAAPSLNVMSGISVIAGAMIGSGIFSTGSTILGIAGSPGMAILMWVFGGLVAYCGGFTYVEWGLMIPEGGGDMPYLDYAYPRPRQLLSFLYCWCRTILIHTGYTSMISIIVGRCIWHAFFAGRGLSDYQYEWYIKGFALIPITLAFLLCALSNVAAARAMSSITLVKISILSFVVISGIVAAAGGFPNATRNVNNFSASKIFANSATSPAHYAEALYSVFFCYDGWANLAMCVGELRDPTRNIPRVIIGGVSIVSLLYVLANISYLIVLDKPDAVAASTELGAHFGKALYGEFFGTKIMSLLIMISAFGACLSITFAASRVIAASAARRFLPFAEALQQSHPKLGTPLNALIFHCGISLFFIIAIPGGPTKPGSTSVDAFNFLLGMTTYPVWVFYTICTIGLFIVRRREPTKFRPFRVWLICPIVVILTGIFLSVCPFFQGQALPAGLGLLCIFLGMPVYYFLVYRPRRLSPQ